MHSPENIHDEPGRSTRGQYTHEKGAQVLLAASLLDPTRPWCMLDLRQYTDQEQPDRANVYRQRYRKGFHVQCRYTGRDPRPRSPRSLVPKMRSWLFPRPDVDQMLSFLP